MGNHTASYIVFSAYLGFLYHDAKKYKNDAIEMNKNNPNNCIPTFQLLSSLAFELLPKVLLGYETCIKYKLNTEITEDYIIKKIFKDLRNYGHDIKKIYFHFPDLIDSLNIKNIVFFENGQVCEYRINLKDSNNKYIAIKDIEAIRYGFFAKNPNIATFSVNDKILIDLLEKIDKYIKQEEIKTNQILKKCYKSC